MKRIAVLTSGGDAPGMNAALRAVVRVGVSSGLEVIGVRQGYTGLIEGQLQPLGPRDVASIIHVGGTMLGSARSAEFRTPEGRKRALQVLEQNRADGLVVIGGNGSLTTSPSTRFCSRDPKSTRLNSSHDPISYAVFCLKKKNTLHCLMI